VNLEDHASHANFPLQGGSMGMTDMLTSREEKPESEKVRNKDYTTYEEGIYVGYRHFDKAGLPVSFPFGYGLSYTDFEFGEMKATLENDTIQVRIPVTNVGDHAGKEVVQVYVSKPEASVDRPVRELKAFAKTHLLQPGDTAEFTLQIPVSDLRYWNETRSGWALEKGDYSIEVGASSRDIRESAAIEL